MRLAHYRLNYKWSVAAHHCFIVILLLLVFNSILCSFLYFCLIYAIIFGSICVEVAVMKSRFPSGIRKVILIMIFCLLTFDFASRRRHGEKIFSEGLWSENNVLFVQKIKATSVWWPPWASWHSPVRLKESPQKCSVLFVSCPYFSALKTKLFHLPQTRQICWSNTPGALLQHLHPRITPLIDLTSVVCTSRC